MADAFASGGVAQRSAKRLHSDMDADPWGLRYIEEIGGHERHAGHARGMRAIRKIEEDMIERLRGAAHDGRRAEGSKDGTHRGVHGDPKEGGTRARNAREENRQAGRPVLWMDEGALEQSLVESTTHQ